ncbi:MAG: adenine-specific DNA-methyltransferase, partial [Rubrobacteraceae bacterium]|nr:adenine-specific DNA-methyltransferase [Rubrobacteraceae bacterium]
MNDGFLAPALQVSLPLPEAVPQPEEIKRVSHGVVYTKSWVVELILDLSGYESSKNLVDKIAIEPSCGVGEFLEPMVRRLSASCHEQGRPLPDCA